MLKKALLYGLSIADDLLVVGGAVAIVTGVSQIYQPAGWIVAGIMLIAAGFFIAREIPNEEIPDDIA